MNYIIIYLEVKHLLNFLSQTEKGDFLDLLISYAESGEIKSESKNVLNVFNSLRHRLDSQIEKAAKKAKVARENGASGGRPLKRKKPKKTQSEPKITQWVLPAFVSENTWLDFVSFRTSIKKSLSVRAGELILKDLGAFEARQKNSANLALENSIKNSWQGVFEPKPSPQQKPKQIHNNFSNQDYMEGTDGFDLN